MVNQCSDLVLVNNLKNNQFAQDSLSELINRHSGIFFDIVNNYTQSFRHPYQKEEIVNDIEYLFWKTSLKYEDDKGTKFSTFLGNETKWHCLNSGNKTKRYYKSYESPENISEEEEDEDLEITPETVDKIFDIIDTHPDERVHKIFKMRYLDPNHNKLTPWRTVGKKLNLSIQGCINIHNQALGYIRKQLSKNEFNLHRTNQ